MYCVSWLSLGDHPASLATGGRLDVGRVLLEEEDDPPPPQARAKPRPTVSKIPRERVTQGRIILLRA